MKQGAVWNSAWYAPPNGGWNLMKQCSTDNDCSPQSNVFCLDNVCIQLGQYCNDNSDCPFPSLTLCGESRCTKSGAVLNIGTVPSVVGLTGITMCSTDSDCPTQSNMFCLENVCVQLGQQCSTRSQCPFPSFTTCMGSRCTKAMSMSSNPYSQTGGSGGNQLTWCTNDYDCSVSSQIYCLENVCVQLGQHCSATSQCPFPTLTSCTGSQCTKATTSSNSYPQSRSGGYQHMCKNDFDCSIPSQIYCLENVCVQLGQQCSTNSQCPFPTLTSCTGSHCTKAAQGTPSRITYYAGGSGSPTGGSGSLTAGSGERPPKTCSHDYQCSVTSNIFCIEGVCIQLGQQCSQNTDCPFPTFTVCVLFKCIKAVTAKGTCFHDAST
ncbi:hypothetical protein OSTOST_07740 [Ostertagia ostertagi]